MSTKIEAILQSGGKITS